MIVDLEKFNILIKILKSQLFVLNNQLYNLDAKTASIKMKIITLYIILKTKN